MPSVLKALYGKKISEYYIEDISPKLGMRVVTSENFGPKDVDATARLTRIIGTNAQAVLVNGATPSAPIVTKNARQLGIKIHLVYGPAYDINFMKLEGEAANGVIFVSSRMIGTPILPLEDPQKQLLLRFKEQ
jgi:branched-chain amino acid transport system substrate-binding protein